MPSWWGATCRWVKMHEGVGQGPRMESHQVEKRAVPHGHKVEQAAEVPQVQVQEVVEKMKV